MKKSCLSILTAFLLLWSSQVFALDASHDFFQKKDVTRKLKKANMHYIQTPNPNSDDFLPVVKRLVRLNNQEFHSIVGVHTNNLERSKTVFYAVGEKKKIQL